MSNYNYQPIHNMDPNMPPQYTSTYVYGNLPQQQHPMQQQPLPGQQFPMQPLPVRPQYPMHQYPHQQQQYPSQYQQYSSQHQHSPGDGTYPNSGYTDPDENDIEKETISAFSEKSVRQAFIRKVYAILFMQLIVSIAIVALFVLVKSLNHFARGNRSVFWSAWVITIVLMIAIACCEGPRRSFPLNFIMLGLFTIAESYLMGVISAFYKVNEVLMAMGIVAVVTLAITIFAFQTKYDFTMMGGCLFVAVIVLLCFGILTIFFHSKIIRIVYASLGALIFGLYLVFDTQIMMGGGKSYALSPEDYVFAALNLYVDIIMLYVHILQLIGLAGGD